MATYVILNIVVLLAVCVLLRLRPGVPSKAWAVTLIVILLLTLVFDNLLIYLGMFSYAPDKILGLYVWRAPVEDFMYALLAVILIPAVWRKLGTEDAKR